jgi:hypothetical protein
MAWHWPDEEAERRLKYPRRFGIEPLAKLDNVPLGPGSTTSLSEGASCSLSGQQQSRARKASPRTTRMRSVRTPYASRG